MCEQSERNECWLRKIREALTGDPSRAKSVWSILRHQQRMLLVHAAGLHPSCGSYKWNEFDNQQLQALARGLEQLKILIDLFKTCRDVDFSTASRKPANSMPYLVNH